MTAAVVLGERLVSEGTWLALEGASFEVDDLDGDVSPAKFVAATRTKDADLAELFAFLTTAMINKQTAVDRGGGCYLSIVLTKGVALMQLQVVEALASDGSATHCRGYATQVFTGVNVEFPDLRE